MPQSELLAKSFDELAAAPRGEICGSSSAVLRELAQWLRVRSSGATLIVVDFGMAKHTRTLRRSTLTKGMFQAYGSSLVGDDLRPTVVSIPRCAVGGWCAQISTNRSGGVAATSCEAVEALPLHRTRNSHQTA